MKIARRQKGSTMIVALHPQPGTVAGFRQITSLHTTSVVPTICVLHWP